MKHLILMAALSLAPFAAQAVIADTFECKISLVDNTTNDKHDQFFTFQVARLPQSSSPAPDVRLTSGTMSTSSVFETSKNMITANASLYYTHAIKIDNVGHVKEARQTTCMVISADACSKGGNEDYKMCRASSEACAISPDPFDPTHGWQTVPVVGEIPTFQVRDLSATTAKIKDENDNPVGQVVLDCKFKGTFE